MKIFLAGATGFIGRELTAKLKSAGHHLVVVSRNPRERTSDSGIEWVRWDGRSLGDWCNAMKPCEAVVNLLGESLAARRWTPKVKARLRSSRVDLTSLIVGAMKDSNVRTLINASAVGYYGNIEEGDVDESFPPASDFLGKLCSDWEDAAFRAGPDRRVVTLRTGIVLGRDGGALKEMIQPFRFFAGGHLGSGRAWFPWIHLHDVVRAIEFALVTPELSGPANLCAPNPVRMREFARKLGRTMNRPSWAHPPKWALRLLLGEFANYLVAGQKAIPKKLLDNGFQFEFPDLDLALQELIQS